MGFVEKRIWGRRPDFHLPDHGLGQCILYPAKATLRNNESAAVENGTTFFVNGYCQIFLLRGKIIEDIYFPKRGWWKLSYESTTLPLLKLPKGRKHSYDWNLALQNDETKVEAFYFFHKNIPTTVVLPMEELGFCGVADREKIGLQLELENILLFLSTLARYECLNLTSETFPFFLAKVIADKGKAFSWEEGCFLEKLPLWLGEMGFGVRVYVP